MKQNYKKTITKILGIIALCLGLNSTAFAQCTASAGFTYTIGSGGQVSFTNTSSVPADTIVSYYWNFGDNTTSTDTNINHTYNYNGTYEVYLYAYVYYHHTNPDSLNNDTTLQISCVSNSHQTITISNSTPCNLQASFTYTLGSNGDVSFTNTSTGTNSFTQYNWNALSSSYSFDSLNASGATTFTYNFIINGTYQVSLYAYNTDGTCANAYLDSITITNGITCANIQTAFTYSVGSNGQVSFINTSTNLPSYPNYLWDFGDGNTSSLSSPSHTYLYNSVSYNVSLIISDSMHSSCPSNGTYNPVTITNATPCNIQPHLSYTLGSNGQINVAISATGADSASQYVLNFGDGSIYTLHDSTASSPLLYTYSSNGSYSLTLNVQSSGTSCIGTVTDSVSITNVTGSSCTPSIGFYVHQDSLNPQPGIWEITPYYSNVVNAIWYWGDGTSSNGLYPPTHIYANVGWYEVWVGVISSCGDSAVSIQWDSLYRVNSSNSIIQITVVNAASSGISNINAKTSDVSVYPNPASTTLQVAGTTTQDVISIYNVIGNEVLRTKENTIDISALQSGVYFVRVNNTTQKFIKQ